MNKTEETNIVEEGIKTEIILHKGIPANIIPLPEGKDCQDLLQSIKDIHSGGITGFKREPLVEMLTFYLKRRVHRDIYRL